MKDIKKFFPKIYFYQFYSFFAREDGFLMVWTSPEAIKPLKCDFISVIYFIDICNVYFSAIWSIHFLAI